MLLPAALPVTRDSQIFIAYRSFHAVGFCGIWKIIFGFFLGKNRVCKNCPRLSNVVNVVRIWGNMPLGKPVCR
jgi:hypothetical protein